MVKKYDVSFCILTWIIFLLQHAPLCFVHYIMTWHLASYALWLTTSWTKMQSESPVSSQPEQSRSCFQLHSAAFLYPVCANWPAVLPSMHELGHWSGPLSPTVTDHQHSHWASNPRTAQTETLPPPSSVLLCHSDQLSQQWVSWAQLEPDYTICKGV